MSQIAKTRAWIRANKIWLTEDHAPMTENLIMLAEAADSEKTTKGAVGAALATAYRLTYSTLMDLKREAHKTTEHAVDDNLLEPR